MSMFLLYDLAAELCHRYRQNKPLSLFHYTPLEYLRRIPFFYIDRFLRDDLAAVSDLVHKMNGSTRHLYASFERRDMRSEPVEAVPAECRDE